MNEQNLGRKVARLLDHSVGDIKQGTLYRLQSARRAAMEMYAAAEPATGWISTGHAAVQTGPARFLNIRYLLPFAALIIALAGAIYWQAAQQASGNDLAEIDTVLLADELPINAYLDKEFDAWLKRSSQ